MSEQGSGSGLLRGAMTKEGFLRRHMPAQSVRLCNSWDDDAGKRGLDHDIEKKKNTEIKNISARIKKDAGTDGTLVFIADMKARDHCRVEM